LCKLQLKIGKLTVLLEDPEGAVRDPCVHYDGRRIVLLALCEAGRRRLEEIKRFDMPGFRPRPEYVREMKRYGVLPLTFDATQDPIDVYAVDRLYWGLFGWNPHPQP
jgi:hypothetical protein